MKKTCLLVIFVLFIALSVYAGDYVIGGGDTLQISVWGSPELSIETVVRPDGKISIPALGEIRAAGMTPMELTKKLEKDMSSIIKTPIVTVIVTNMTNYRIFVFGEGAPAGVNILKRETTLLEFLSQLGSLENADLENAYLVRNKKKIKENFYDLFARGKFSQDIVLEYNDMLFIPDIFAKRINVVGAVKNPMTITYKEGLTLLDVVLSAGGFTEFANKSHVTILRTMKNGEKKEISVNAKELMKGDLQENIRIMPGDLVLVKESLF